MLVHPASQALQPLLQPVFLHRASAILEHPRRIPASPGIYAWWFRSLPDVKLDRTIKERNYHLLYVGIVPSRNDPSGDLRERIHDIHLRGTMRCSMLRRALAGFLKTRLQLTVDGPPSDPFEESRLTEWIAGHGAVSFLQSSTPWLVEEQLIETGPALPLNAAETQHL